MNTAIPYRLIRIFLLKLAPAMFVLAGLAASGREGFIQAGGIRVHYAKQGSGPPLLLLHACYQEMHMWDKQVTFFSPHHTVICFDLPGHGATRGTDTSL